MGETTSTTPSSTVTTQSVTVLGMDFTMKDAVVAGSAILISWLLLR